MSHNNYGLTLQEADGKLIVASERLGYYSSETTITEYQPETTVKTYNDMTHGDYIKGYRRIYVNSTSKILEAVRPLPRNVM